MSGVNHTGLTPMLRQYFDLKEQADGAVLFFRMGDFYEIFGDDAAEIAPILDIVLTSRERGDQTKIPFCGVPHHSATSYWLRLVKRGYKVAIVEQLEEASPGKGLVRRGIVKIHTPGSIDELEGLERGEPNYLVSFAENPGVKSHAFCACDVSTGELRLGEVSEGELREYLAFFKPREVLVRRYARQATEVLCQAVFSDHSVRVDVLPEQTLKDEAAQTECWTKVFGQTTLKIQPCGDVRGGRALIVATLNYIESLHRSTGAFLRVLPLKNQEAMILSETALRDLEIFETARRRDTEGSLIRVIDRTLSPMGARRLRSSLAQPFAKERPILDRQEALTRMIAQGEGFLSLLRDQLRGTADLTRLATRLVSGSSGPAELGLIRETLSKASSLIPVLKNIETGQCELANVVVNLNAAQQVQAILQDALVDAPSALGGATGVFRRGYNDEFDRHVELAVSGQVKVEEYEHQLKQSSGITSLKVRDHKSFGLLIEVTKSNLSKVPASFIRRQTMTNCERFTTIELKELSERLSSAFDLAVAAEVNLYQQLLVNLRAHLPGLLAVAEAIATVDLLQSMAWIALKEDWTRPKIGRGVADLKIQSGRHPVVEKIVGRHQYTANHVEITKDRSHLLITGPNMAGKSTVMRQTAIMAILAQVGSYVPAAKAEVPLFDRIFTRVGAADDLSRGQSTFMVEMTEASEILRQASPQSLVILDEVGRGTSTTDGLAIAGAILEDLVERVGCYTMFATHYHELVELMAHHTSVKPMQTEVLERDHAQIVFTHRLIEGAAESSFGIEVARLAGVPDHVIDKARARLSIIPEVQQQLKETPAKPKAVTKVQRDLFGLAAETTASQEVFPLNSDANISAIVSRLEGVRIHRTTPLQALNILDELKRMLVPVHQRSLFGDEPTHPL